MIQICFLLRSVELLSNALHQTSLRWSWGCPARDAGRWHCSITAIAALAWYGQANKSEAMYACICIYIYMYIMYNVYAHNYIYIYIIHYVTCTIWWKGKTTSLCEFFNLSKLATKIAWRCADGSSTRRPERIPPRISSSAWSAKCLPAKGTGLGKGKGHWNMKIEIYKNIFVFNCSNNM